jgi:hypothetical protein
MLFEVIKEVEVVRHAQAVVHEQRFQINNFLSVDNFTHKTVSDLLGDLWVLAVHEYFTVLELDSFGGLLSKVNDERNHFRIVHPKILVVIDLMPARP